MLTIPPEDESPAARTARRRRRAFFGVSSAVLIVAVILFRHVLLPFFFAIVLAYLLAPVVGWLEGKRIGIGQRVVPRWAAVALVYLNLLALLGIFSAIGAPRLAHEIESLTRETPQAIATLRDEWIPKLEERIARTFRTNDLPQPSPETNLVIGQKQEAQRIRVTPIEGQGYELELPEGGILVEPNGDGYTIRTQRPETNQRGDLDATLTEALRNMSEHTQTYTVAFLKTAQQFIGKFVRGVFTFFIVLMLSAYLIATRDNIFSFFRSLVRTDRRSNFDDLLVRIDHGLAGVVRGQLAIALINGVFSGVLFAVLDLRYWPLLALIAGVLSIIPIFGSVLSTIPVVLIALQQGVGIAMSAVIGIIIIHQIEANLLNPKILGDAAKLHPVLVIFALLAGEHLFGIAGAILAVPVLSTVQSLFLHFREVTLGIPAPKRHSTPPTI